MRINADIEIHTDLRHSGPKVERIESAPGWAVAPMPFGTRNVVGSGERGYQAGAG
jgi:hypothetical protein